MTDDLNDPNNSDDSDNSFIKLDTQSINFRSSQFGLGEEVDMAQTEMQAIVILPVWYTRPN